MSSEELKMRDKSMLWSIDLLSIAVLVSRFPPRLYPAAPWERQTEESLIGRIHFDHFDLNGKSLHHRHQAVLSNCAGCFHEFSWWFHDVSVFFLIYFACYLRALHFGFLQIQRRTHVFWTPRMQHGAHLIEFVCRQMCFLRGNKDVHLINCMFFFVPGVSQSWNARWWRMQNSEFFINELNMHKNAKKHQQIFTLPTKRRSMLRQSQSLYSNFCRYWCLTTFGHAVKASTRKYRQTIGSWLRSADRFTIFRQERWNRIKQDKRQDIKNRKEKNNKTQNRTLLTGFDEVDYQSISL